MEKTFYHYINDSNALWNGDAFITIEYIKATEKYANEIVKSHGYLTVYDLYDKLCIDVPAERAADLASWGWRNDRNETITIRADYGFDGEGVAMIDIAVTAHDLRDRQRASNQLIYKLKEDTEEVANFWGDSMPMMAMEEAGELIQAISKFERYRKNTDIIYSSPFYQDLVDEMGDVFISIMALTNKYYINPKDILERINDKLDKKY